MHTFETKENLNTRSDLAARIAHDIRSPIAVMELYLYSLEDDKNNLGVMRSAIQRLRDIANYAQEKSSADQLALL